MTQTQAQQTDIRVIEAQEVVLPREGFVRLKDVLRLIPVSESTWYKHQAAGVFPRPVQIPGTTTKLYDVADIRALITRIRTEGAA